MKQNRYNLLLILLIIIVGIFSYFILNIHINQTLILSMIIMTVGIIGYYIFKKIGSKFERITLIIIGIIYIVILITPDYTNYNWILAGYILIPPLGLLDWIGKDKNDPKIKKKINNTFWIVIMFIILLIFWVLFSICFYLFNHEISLLNLILLGIGTFISLSLTLEIKQKYFKNIKI